MVVTRLILMGFKSCTEIPRNHCDSMKCPCQPFLSTISSFQYFKNSLNTRLSIVYIEAWQEHNQAAGFSHLRSINQALKDFSDYVGRKLYTVDKDTTQLLT